jgi:hypothetical protein
VKRSGSLLRQTWGETAGGYLSLGAIFVLFALPARLFPSRGSCSEAELVRPSEEERPSYDGSSSASSAPRRRGSS